MGCRRFKWLDGGADKAMVPLTYAFQDHAAEEEDGVVEESAALIWRRCLYCHGWLTVEDNLATRCRSLRHQK